MHPERCLGGVSSLLLTCPNTEPGTLTLVSHIRPPRTCVNQRVQRPPLPRIPSVPWQPRTVAAPLEWSCAYPASHSSLAPGHRSSQFCLWGAVASHRFQVGDPTESSEVEIGSARRDQCGGAVCPRRPARSWDT